MKHIFSRRWAALLLALTLTVTLSAPALARETDLFDVFPQELDFKKLQPSKPDAAAFSAAARALEAALDKKAGEKELEPLFSTLFTQFQQVNTQYNVMQYYYSSNSAAYSTDYLAWGKTAQEVSNRFLELLQQLNDAGHDAVAVKVMGEELAASYSAFGPDTPEGMEIWNRHAQLVDKYWALADREYSVTRDGKTYQGMDAVEEAYSKGTLTREAYTALTLELARKSNVDRGPIFVEIVALLNRYAALYDYDNYGELAYEQYGRDYSKEDAKALYALVKEYFVPLQEKLLLLNWSAPAILDAQEPCLDLFADTNQAELVAMVQPYMGEISSEYAQLFAYMLRCNLLDIEDSETKNYQAYTNDLPAYHSAYIFGCQWDDPYDLSTLVHEFGHFAAMCFGETQNIDQSLDVSEINSQGLEVLYFPYVEDMLGPEAAPYYLAYQINNLVDSVISGCLQDEFLQTVYATPNLTLEQINRIYHDLAESYGYTMADENYGYSWTDINHNFEMPFYYLSYATSALAALDIFDLSLSDYDAACDTYLKLTDLPGGAETDFLDALELAGLRNVFEEKTVASIASGLESYLYGEVCGAAFTDVAGAWYEDEALLCASLGLFSGNKNGAFQPQGTLTQAQAAVLLWRIAGRPTVKESLPGIDADAWYAPAVNWCYQDKMLNEGPFSPAAPVSRQELVAMLYRLANSPELESETLNFRDASQVSAEAKSAMAWAVQTGVIQGRKDGTLAPTALLTRAQAAAMLSNLLLP